MLRNLSNSFSYSFACMRSSSTALVSRNKSNAIQSIIRLSIIIKEPSTYLFSFFLSFKTCQYHMCMMYACVALCAFPSVTISNSGACKPSQNAVHIVWIIPRRVYDNVFLYKWMDLSGDYIISNLNKQQCATTFISYPLCDVSAATTPKPPNQPLGASEQMPDSHTEIVRIHFQVCNPKQPQKQQHNHTNTHSRTHTHTLKPSCEFIVSFLDVLRCRRRCPLNRVPVTRLWNRAARTRRARRPCSRC